MHPLVLVFAPGTGVGSGSLVPFIAQVGLIFAIFYFLLIRPQSKQRQQHESALRNLRKGDEVVTSGGIVGEVVHIKESLKDGSPHKSMDDRVTIRSAESRLIVERGRIAKIVAGTTGTGDRSGTPGGSGGSAAPGTKGAGD